VREEDFARGRMERLIQRTLLEKLEDCGFVVPSPLSLEDYPLTPQVFYPKEGTLSAQRIQKGVLVYYARESAGKKSISIDELKNLVLQVRVHKVQDVILVLMGVLSSKGWEMLESIQIPDQLRITVFQHTELLFNPSRHVRVPKHTLLTPEEGKEWLRNSALKATQLPVISEQDIQARYLDARAGDIIKVERYSITVKSFAHHVLVIR